VEAVGVVKPLNCALLGLTALISVQYVQVDHLVSAEYESEVQLERIKFCQSTTSLVCGDP
jgi:hypothetical protein